MHSPIFYAVQLKNPDHLPSPDALREILPSEDHFIESTQISDWCQMDTSTPGWHRGQFTPSEVRDMLDNEPHYTVTQHGTDWIKVEIKKADYIKEMRHRIKIKRKFLDIVEKGFNLGYIVDAFVPKGPDSPFTDEEHHTALEHFRLFDHLGGIRFAMYAEYEHQPSAPIEIEEFPSIRDIDDSIAWRLDKDTDTYTFYVSSVVTGDYHF